MDLPDCPPGAEGYQDSVVEVPKKPDAEDSSCTKAEQEFQDHLNSLKIKLENGETRCMVERRGRDISGKWIYLCYPCGSVCSGESILQTHISGKKHKIKLSMRSTWPMSIFDDHPFNQNQKGGSTGSTATEQVLQKMAVEVEMHKQKPSELEQKYNKYRNATCHIQDILDALKAPLVGVEYLIEHPPEKAHYEPTYMCTLCTKQGHPRTIVNHLTCFWHRYNYLLRHFSIACSRMAPYKNVHKYREGVSMTMHRLSQRIEDKFGRLRPVNIDKEEYDREKEAILQWIFKGYHFSEKSGVTLEEVVDVDLIESIAKSAEEGAKKQLPPKKKDPSPPVVAAPSKPAYNARAARRERRVSMDSLSDISDDDGRRVARDTRAQREKEGRGGGDRKRWEAPSGGEPRAEPVPAFRSRYQVHVAPEGKRDEGKASRNHEYKQKLAEEKAAAAADAAATMLAYHEKNPEKHPLYPEEWKKFWNKRYKEIQAEGKDPSKHDFKPEWIVYWTKRMKELHLQELQSQVTEVYRRLNIPPPDVTKQAARADRRSDSKRRSPERRRSPDRRRPPERRRSPVWEPRVERRPSPERRRSPPRRRSPERRRSPARRPDRRSPNPYVLDRRPQAKRESDAPPAPAKRTRSRSPDHSRHASQPEGRRSRSPLSRRESELRNRSPLAARDPPPRNRSPARDLAPSLQTVMISDDELKPDDGLSPWNSDNDIESVVSMPRSHAGSHVSHVSSRARHPPPRTDPADMGPPENIVATLRVLVALEDYLGSIGPKIVDLLTEALKMEKERANSSEELLEREAAVVMIETAKEKLKGAAQAGLVAAAAAPAVRAAVVRAAHTLHEADTRARRNHQHKLTAAATSKAEPVPVAGVGAVDRAQIAQQMAAALIAQGKTDVTSEELAQLVDAVVGMAEAKKREAEAAAKPEAKPAPPAPAPAKMSGTATALQMLQSAYDENDKKVEKEDAPDAMDGLSDSDLETLLKNFNELSAEEQHSLIAYLKKLEAREPQRVERLRQYVSAAATAAPADDPPPRPEPKTVAIESDDDDYTVEEVFQSATQKVKEDQIRKELDVVKKSLEVSKEDPKEKPTPAPVKPTPAPTKTPVNILNQMSSASDLFALVQASIKSTAAPISAQNTQTINVISSASQPRSFGDVPEKPLDPAPKAQISPLIPVTAVSNPPFDSQDEPTAQQQYDDNYQNDQFNRSDSYDQPWDDRQMNNAPDDSMGDQGYNNNFSQGQSQFSGGNEYDQGPNPKPNKFGQVPNSGPNHFGQSNQGANQFGQGNHGPNQFRPGNQGPNQFGQGNQGPNQFGLGNQGPNQLGQGNQGPNQFGQGNQGPNQFGQGNQGPNQYGQGNQGPNQYGQGNQGPNQFAQGNQGPNQFGQRPNTGSNQFGQGQGQDWQGSQRPNPNWQPNQFNQGQNQFSQGPRGNMKGRMDDNFGNRPKPYDNANQQQKFGNYDNPNNFRGRGRGNVGGGPARRGRGRF